MGPCCWEDRLVSIGGPGVAPFLEKLNLELRFMRKSPLWDLYVLCMLCFVMVIVCFVSVLLCYFCYVSVQLFLCFVMFPFCYYHVWYVYRECWLVAYSYSFLRSPLSSEKSQIAIPLKRNKHKHNNPIYESKKEKENRKSKQRKIQQTREVDLNEHKANITKHNITKHKHNKHKHTKE